MKHSDPALHTRGQSEYVDDTPPPADMLFAAVLGSPEAHGKLVGLNPEEALRYPGVVAVLTAADIPGENQIGPIIQDEPLLAVDAVHFRGQPLAIVVAESPEAARSARGKIDIQIEPLPAITDPLEAFGRGDIIGATRHFAMGDTDSAWDKCACIVEGTAEVGGQEHVYLETQRARAIPVENGGLKIYSSTQSPYAGQRTIGRILDLPFNKIEVEVRRLGGGFGGKEDQATPWACVVALAAVYTGRPVEIVLSRMDDMMMTGKRHPYVSKFKLGASKDGKFIAYAAEHFQNAGAAADLSPAVLERTVFHSTNAYFVPNVRVFAASCRTNLPPNTAFRGFGGPQGMFAIESAIAALAEKLGISREEIQKRNLIDEGDLFHYGQKAEGARAKRTWDEAENAYDLAGIRAQIDAHNSNHFGVKKGVAVMPVCFGIAFTNTSMNQGSALVHVYTDGSVGVSTGGVEMGQGINAKIQNIAAKTFGIREGRIKVETTNTTRIANMSPSAASATTDLNGNATMQAIGQILSGLRGVAGKKLRIDDASIEIKDELVLVDGEPSELGWAELIQEAYLSRKALSAHAFYATPGIYFDKTKEKGRPFAYHAYGTAILEVTVDCIRGIYDVDAVKIVHDLGRPVNELVDLGQIEGGLAQGLGWMTMEDLQYAEDGRLLSHALATYKVPDVYFMPDDLQVKLLENVDSPTGPYGSKAVGEPPLMYGIGVFFALQSAMRAFAPDAELAFHAPMTPERVLMGLRGRLKLKEQKHDADYADKNR